MSGPHRMPGALPGEEQSSAILALKAHLSRGARLVLPTPGHARTRTLGALAAAGLGALAIQPALADNQVSRPDAGGASAHVRAGQVGNTRYSAGQPAGLEQLDPEAPATPQSISLIADGIEKAVLDQFPEMRGRFAVYNEFKAPDAEAQRIAHALSIDDGVSWAIEDRLDGFNGGQAKPMANGDGAPACVMILYPHAPERQMNNLQYAKNAVHEAFHCLDPATYEFLETMTIEQIHANRKDQEVVAVVGSKDWEMRQGQSLKDFDATIARKRTSGNPKNVPYQVEDEMIKLRANWSGTKGTGVRQIDFGNLQASLDRVITLRDASRETPEGIIDIRGRVSALEAVYAQLDDGGRVADNRQIRDWLKRNAEIGFVGAAHRGFEYLDAQARGKPAPSVPRLWEGSLPADRAYATASRLLKGRNEPADRAFLAAIEEWAIQSIAYRMGKGVEPVAEASEAAFLAFKKRIDTDQAYASAVAGGRVSPIQDLAEKHVTHNRDPALSQASEFLRSGERVMTRQERIHARFAATAFEGVAQGRRIQGTAWTRALSTLEYFDAVLPARANLTLGTAAAAKLYDISADWTPQPGALAQISSDPYHHRTNSDRAGGHDR